MESLVFLGKTVPLADLELKCNVDRRTSMDDEANGRGVGVESVVILWFSRRRKINKILLDTLGQSFCFAMWIEHD